MYNREPLSSRTVNLNAFQLDYDSIQRGVEEKCGYANVMYQRLVDQIMQFQAQLKPDEEVGAYLASFGREVYLHIEQVGYSDPYYIIFSGTLGDGQRARLVQHVSQNSILLIAAKVEPEENRKPHRIGFMTEDT
jgi:hypothetical protein